MKTFQAYILIIICILIFSAAQSQLYQWHEQTEQDAIQTVKDFEGNQNLQVTITNNPTIVEENRYLFADYTLIAGNREYFVNKYSNDYIYFYDTTFLTNEDIFYGQPFNPDILKNQIMTQQSAETIARNYLLQHYPNPSSLTLSGIYENHNHGYSDFVDSYEFSFIQSDVNGCESPMHCTIEVDSVMGSIISYSRSTFPQLISSTPLYSYEEALAIALYSVNITNVADVVNLGLGISKPDNFGQEYLEYSITFTGIQQPTHPYITLFCAYVDANTGNLVMLDTAGGLTTPSSKKKDFSLKMKTKKYSLAQLMKDNKKIDISNPPILIDNQPYIYAQYLCYGDKDARLVDKGKGIWAIESPKRNIVFNLKSKDYSFLDTNKEGQATEAEKKKLPAKPKLINGRLYVPLSALQDVVPFKVGYEKTDKFIWFGAPPKKDSKTKTKESAMLGVGLAPALAFMGKVLFSKVC